jgi:hypothetical protein
MGSFAYSCFASTQRTISNTAQSFSATSQIQEGCTHDSGAVANRVEISCFTNGVVLRLDGGTATASAGILIPAGSRYTVEGEYNVRQISIIRAGGSDATISIDAFI